MALAPKAQGGSLLERFVPIVGWLPNYHGKWLSADVLVAIGVWALVVPEALAYAGIAGVPVQYGLYAIPLAVIGYAVFGTSRQLFVGPSSTVAALSAATVAGVGASSGSDDWISLTVALAILVGVLHVIFGLLRFGFLANFLASPVLNGFIFGLGWYIAVGQLPKLFGIEGGDGNTVEQFFAVFADYSDWLWITVAIGAASLALLFLLERFAPKAPGALIVAGLAIAVVSILNLSDEGVEIVGAVPTGFAGFGFAGVGLDQIAELIPGALGIIVVGFAQSVAIAKSFAAKYDYTIDPSQEMIGYGAANIGGGLLQGFTVTGSLSKSSLFHSSGGKTPVAQFVVSGLTILTVLFIVGIFEKLPEAALGAIVIHAVWGMMQPEPLIRLWKMRSTEFWLAGGAAAGVILIDILPGIAIGVVLSLILYLHKTDKPHAAVLGDNRSTGQFGDVSLDDNFEPIEGVLVYRFDCPIIFANVDHLTGDVRWLVGEADQAPHTVVIDCEMSWEIDITAFEALQALRRTLDNQDISLVLARVHGSVRDGIAGMGIDADSDEPSIYPTVSEAPTRTTHPRPLRGEKG